jgi:hypothetical protein
MSIKYIWMDVHKEAISIAVMNGDGINPPLQGAGQVC